jgi:hypothetical protein
MFKKSVRKEETEKCSNNKNRKKKMQEKTKNEKT